MNSQEFFVHILSNCTGLLINIVCLDVDILLIVNFSNLLYIDCILELSGVVLLQVCAKLLLSLVASEKYQMCLLIISPQHFLVKMSAGIINLHITV